ncbi:MAG TPA: septum site-determining protein Ssd [Mycobacterium sp.]|nr:septum site-determining protein Ssd [Mycobacterium sp.]
MLSQPELRGEVDRVGAAVGIRVIHCADSAEVSRKTWLAAVAVVLDEEAATRCEASSLPRHPRLIVVAGGQPSAATWRTAIGLGAHQVLALPAAADELVRVLADADEAAADDGRRRGEVVAVIGGRGGAGASVFATALALAAGDALLVDLDPFGGGIDLLAGSENLPGLRWPDLQLQTGRLAWPAVRAALPRCPGAAGVSVLSGTRRPYEVDPPAVDAVVDAGRRGGVVVVCDLPRTITDVVETALDTADLVVLVSPCNVRACAASAAIAPRLRAANPNIGLVVRGPSPGGLRAAEVADITGLPLLAAMRAEPRLTERLEHDGLRPARRSALAGAARHVLELLATRDREPAR